ncbi:unnamed protein product [Timema podura]|uniref:Uncharacterized protein n=1 Tax=Timema podura TaxID=61482 RepID=A0ABN7NQJ5_TIMPD|nr:unnamed protein product [Timema podura]
MTHWINPKKTGRVENIKKRFEVRSQSGNHGTNIPESIDEISNHKEYQTYKKISVPQRPKTTRGVVGQLRNSNGEGRGNIRRSPAFRCDKSVCGKNVINCDKQQSLIESRLKTFESCQNVKSVVKKLNSCGADSNKEFSNTYKTPIEKEQNSQNTYGVLIKEVTNLCVNSPFAQELKNDNTSYVKQGSKEEYAIKTMSKPVHLSYSNSACISPLPSYISKENLESIETTHASQLKIKESISAEKELTNTLKAVLKTPLPKGPPPKKPPRTFAHTVMLENKSQNPIETEHVPCKAVTSMPLISNKDKLQSHKFDSHKKLEKLEKALHNHNHITGIDVLKPKSPLFQRTTINKSTDPSRIEDTNFEVDRLNKNISGSVPVNQMKLQGHPLSKTKTKSFPLRLLNSLDCVSSQGAAYAQIQKCNIAIDESKDCHTALMSSFDDTALHFNLRKELNEVLHKSHSVEHIYAEPCTVGVKQKLSKSETNPYMVDDFIVKWCRQII